MSIDEVLKTNNHVACISSNDGECRTHRFMDEIEA